MKKLDLNVINRKKLPVCGTLVSELPLRYLPTYIQLINAKCRNKSTFNIVL